MIYKQCVMCFNNQIYRGSGVENNIYIYHIINMLVIMKEILYRIL